MLGDYLTALLIAVLGYVYPAYLCFKVRLASRPPSRARPDVQISSPSTPTSRRSRDARPDRLPPRFSLPVSPSPPRDPQALEKHKRKPEALRGWCIYWTVMALYTAGTQVSDRFVFWLPMYSEAKVAFVVYLWHPRTQGALYVYDAFVAPFLAKHETAIDRHIDETRVSVGDVIARRARDAVEFAREKFAAALTALPQSAQRGQGGGFGARSATEAAAMAYARGPKQN